MKSTQPEAEQRLMGGRSNTTTERLHVPPLSSLHLLRVYQDIFFILSIQTSNKQCIRILRPLSMHVQDSMS